MRTHVPQKITNGFVRLDNKLGTSAAGTEVILLMYTLQNPLQACNMGCLWSVSHFTAKIQSIYIEILIEKKTFCLLKIVFTNSLKGSSLSYEVVKLGVRTK